jgi:hypothetical protein
MRAAELLVHEGLRKYEADEGCAEEANLANINNDYEVA